MKISPFVLLYANKMSAYTSRCSNCSLFGHFTVECKVDTSKSAICNVYGCKASMCRIQTHVCPSCDRVNVCRGRNHYCPKCNGFYKDFIFYENNLCPSCEGIQFCYTCYSTEHANGMCYLSVPAVCSDCQVSGHVSSECRVPKTKSKVCNLNCGFSNCRTNKHHCRTCGNFNRCRSSDHVCKSCQKVYKDKLLYDNPCDDCRCESKVPEPVVSKTVSETVSKTVSKPKLDSRFKIVDSSDVKTLDFDNSATNFVAGVVLFDKNGNVLLQKAASWLHGGNWGLPGGSRDHNESPYETGIREFSEETGYDLSDATLIGAVSYRNSSYSTVNLVYKTRKTSWTNNGKCKHEVDTTNKGIPACFGHAWFAPHEVAGVLSVEFMRDIVKQANTLL